MIVDSLMRRSVLTLPEGTTARAAAVLMKERGVGSVVVVRGGALTGIVTERDLVQRVLALVKDPDRTLLGEIMTSPVATIEPAASVEEAAHKMKELKVKRLVVALDGQVRGIVTVTDIAYAEPDLTRGLVEGWVKQRWE